MAHWTRQLGVGNVGEHVAPTSRYANTPLQYYTEQRLLTFTTYKRRKSQASPGDKWLQITRAVEYRPDLVSFEVYGTWELWWQLLEANNMKDILEFKAGVNIRLPGNVMA